MSRSVFVFLLFIAIPVRADTDDWIGLDSYGGHIGLHWGAYQAGGENYSMNIALPMFYSSQFNAFYSDYRSDRGVYSQQSQQLGLYWNSDPFQRISWGGGYSDNGRSSDLQTLDYSLYIQYLANNQWYFRFTGLQGESVIDANGYSPVIENRFRSLGLHKIDRIGWGISFGLDGLNHGVRLGATYFDYDDSGSAPKGQVDQFIEALTTNEERFYYQEIYIAYFEWFKDRGFSDEESRIGTNWAFLNDIQEIRDQVNRRVAEDLDVHLGIDQKNALSNHELSLDYFYSHNSFVISMGLFIYESYIRDEYSNQSYATINYQATEHYSYGLTLSYSDESAELYGEFSLGFDW
ncbi:MAG: hypothetical protein K6L81_03870 [Agarilytica sp.]